MSSNVSAQSTGRLLRDSAWTVMRRVIGALLLRELLTRYGRNNLGFLWLFVEPMLFVGIVVTVRTTMQSAGFALHIPIVAFALTGWTSLLLWRNMPGRCVGAHKSNLSLLHHRPVTILDVYIARVVVEFLAITTTFVGLSIGACLMDWTPPPEDALQVLCGWLLLAWFGVGLGWTVGSLSERAPIVGTLWRPFSYILMFSAGVFYLADTLPPRVRDILMWLPMMSALEYLREGWFGSMFTAHYDVLYVVVCNLVLTFAGLSLVRQVGTDVTEE